MSQAIFDTVSVDIDADKYNFRASGQTLKFKGFMALYVEGNDEELEEKDVILPELEEGQTLSLEETNPLHSLVLHG